MRRTRFLIIPLLVLGVVFAYPAVAMAHAGLVTSNPEPGAELGTAPGVVVLRFTEPLNVRLSRASVTTPDGATVNGEVMSSQEISVGLSTNAQGTYEVEWSTVSLLDGHTLTGSFAFGVGVPVGPEAVGGTSTSPRSTDLLIALARLAEDAALLLAAGLMLLGRLARRKPPLGWLRGRPDVAIGAALLGGVAVVLGEAITAAHGLSPGAVVSYLTTGLPGVARLARPALELVALVLALRSSRWTAVPVAAAIVALAAAGHAAAVDPPWWGIAVESVHVGGAALWAGGVLALALQHPLKGWTGRAGRKLLDRFTPVALAAFVATAVAGLLRGLQEVGGVHALVATSYGVTLLVKTLLVVLMAQLSVFAWRRLFVRPGLESAVAVAIVVAAVLLAAYPLPPARLSEAEAAEATLAASATALPLPGDLTMGAHAGEFLVGLTIRPPSNEALVYIHGLGSDADAGARKVDVSVDGLPVDVTGCGDTCRRVATALGEGARVGVTVGGANGGTARFLVPSLDSPPADALLSEMNARMHALNTYRLDETLTSGFATIRSGYIFTAPSAFEGHTVEPDGTGSRIVWIGDTRYLRQLPGGDWKVEQGTALPTVPLFVWDSFVPYVDARLGGHSVIDGVRTNVVLFFGGDPTLPVWFRLWIDRTGLVHRAEMRALGHFMDHRYYAFDRSIAIEPPADAGAAGGTDG